jgi:hypothetical protein
VLTRAFSVGRSVVLFAEPLRALEERHPAAHDRGARRGRAPRGPRQQALLQVYLATSPTWLNLRDLMNTFRNILYTIAGR